MRRLLIWLLFAGVLALTATARYQPGWLQTDILALAGDSSVSPDVAGAQRKLNAQLQGGVLWMLVAPADNAAELAKATEVLAQKLRASPSVTSVQYHWADSAGYAKEWKTLFPLRQQLLVPADRYRLLHEPDKLVQRQLAALYGPEGAGLDLQHDPFATFRRYFSDGPQLATRVYGQIPVQQRNDRAFTLVQSTAMSTRLNGQIDTPLLKLRESLKQWAAQRGMTLLSVGAPLHTEYAAAGAQREIRLIGGLSMAAICLLSLLVFRSVRPLLLSLFAIGSGIACGAATVIALLGHMHILAFVFGTTVTGLAIDYAFHFICNRLRPGPVHDGDIMPGLTLGLLSSCLAFFALALTPFPLLRQMGVFVGAGLIGAWLTVVLLFPLFLKLRQRPLEFAARLPQVRPGYYTAALGFLLLLGVASLPRMEFGDDLQLFYQPPQFLADDEAQLNRLLPSRAESSYFLVHGGDWRELLQREWKLTGYLQSQQTAGVLEDFQSISERFPPEDVQRANWQLLRNFYGSAPVSEFYRQLGYGTAETQQLVSALQQPFRQVTLQDWLAVAGRQYAGLWLGCDTGGCASVVRLFGLQHSLPLPEAMDGVEFVDPPRAIAAVMSQQRDLLLRLLPLVALVVLAVVALRTGLRRAFNIVALPMAAVTATLATTILAGSPVNLFHVAALLLIFGIGVDYAVFCQLSPASERSYTLLAVAMAGITTLLGFGLLALSATPALADFGLTLGVGTTLTMFLATLFFAKAVEEGNR